jgi:hypothetical protein
VSALSALPTVHGPDRTPPELFLIVSPLASAVALDHQNTALSAYSSRFQRVRYSWTVLTNVAWLQVSGETDSGACVCG